MLSNEQRYALAAKMLSIVERMAFAGEKPAATVEAEPQEMRNGEVIANRLDEALSQFAQAAFQRGPESLRPEDQAVAEPIPDVPEDAFAEERGAQ